MNSRQITEQAQYLDRAMQEGREVERITATYPELTLEDAYLIQDEGISLRQARGETLTGFKVGLTSRAKREQMKLFSPIYGVLTDRMQTPASGTLSLQGSIHPKIEPEIAFRVGRELKGSISLEQAWDACTAIFPALEILDSRFVGFKYFSLPDVVADNSSSSRFHLGPAVDKSELSPQALAELKIDMTVDGQTVQTALSSEISGNPLQSIVQLCELLALRGLSLPAGSIVLAGAATLAVPLIAGQKVAIKIERLGETTVSVVT